MRANIGDFVSAKYPIPTVFMGGMPNAMGLSGFTPGRFGVGDFVNAWYSVPQNPVGLSGVGDFVNAWYSVPQNPVSLSGLGCSGGCSCNKRGMGDITLGSLDLTTWWAGLSTTEQYAIYAGGALAAYMIWKKNKGGR